MDRKFGRALSTCALLVAVARTGPAADPEPGPAAGSAGAPPASVDATGSGSFAVAGPADVILSSGRIITVDDTFTIAHAVAIKGERVLVYDAAAPVTITAPR